MQSQRQTCLAISAETLLRLQGAELGCSGEGAKVRNPGLLRW